MINDKLYEEIEPIILNAHKKYKFLEMNELFDKFVKEVLETVDESNPIIYKKLFQSTLYKLIDNYLVEIVKDRTKLLEVINKYIDTNLTVEKEYEKAFDEIKKYGLFLNSIDNYLLPDIYIEMLNNKKLNSLVKIIIDKEREFIKKNDVSALSNNDNIIALLECFCSLNDIDLIEEDDTLYDVSKGGLSGYVSQMKNKLLTREEEKELAYRIRNNDMEARNILVNHNLRLVISMARKYVGHNVELEDLIQEGNMGLIRATETFDPDKDFKFSTYASWWIKQSITRAIGNSARMIRLPINMVDKVKKLAYAEKELTNKLCKEPSTKELAEYLNTTIEDIENLKKIRIESVSLNLKVNNSSNEEDDSELEDFVEAETVSPEEEVVENNARNRINEIVKSCKLTEREINILLYRNGFLSEEPMTLEEVGKIYGITRERTRQIEQGAMKKIRNSRFKEELFELATSYGIKSKYKILTYRNY